MVKKLDVCPANINLAGAEVELVSMVSRETRLKDAVENEKISEARYNNYKKMYINHEDYIIILRGSAKDKDYQSLEKDFLTLISNIRKEKTNESTKEKK